MEIGQDNKAMASEEKELLKISTEIQIDEFNEISHTVIMEGKNLIDHAFYRYEQSGEIIIRHMTRENYNKMVEWTN